MKKITPLYLILTIFGLLVAASTSQAADFTPVALNVSYQADFYDNEWLSHDPLFTRTDNHINFDWGENAPDSRLGADFFSVRWTSSFYLAEPTLLQFNARADDGIRILVNGQAMLNAYYGEAKPGMTTERRLPAGTHEIVIEYYEYNGTAYAQVEVLGLDGTPLPANPGTPPTSGGGDGTCTIPASGPWPPCATGGGNGGGSTGSETGGTCEIPASGPWPPCATNGGGGQTVPPTDNECVIPTSGPWPACAR